MVDFSKIQDFIVKLENDLGAQSNHNKRIDTSNAAEYSLFMAEMGKQIREGSLGEDDFNEILGLAISDDAKAARSRSADNCNECPPPEQGGRGNLSIYIAINIDINLVVNACGGSQTDLQKLVDMLIAEMTKEGGKVENFILGLIKSSANSSVDLSSIKSLLEEIKGMLGNQSDKIAALQESIDNLKTFIQEQLNRLYQTMEEEFANLGINISNLTELTKSGNQEILQKLADIRQLILDLTNKFDDYTKIHNEHIDQRFEQVIAKIGNISIGNLDDSQIMAKLNLMYTMLESIKADTTKTKDNSQTLIDNSKRIMELIEQGDERIINAVNNIKINVNLPDGYDDTEIKNMLRTILTNMVTKEDLDNQLVEFDKIVKNVQAALELAIKNSETEIIKHIKNISQNIIINPGSEDNEGIVALLNAIMARLNEMDASNKSNFNAVFEAIANIKPGEVDLTKVYNLLEKIDETTVNNGQKIDNVLNNQATITLMLNGIAADLTKLINKVDGVKGVVDEILELVKKLKNCDCHGIDEVRLREILCEFITNIKTDQQPNEAVQGGVDVLGSRRFTRSEKRSYTEIYNDLYALCRNLPGFDNGATAVAAPKTHTETDGKVYDLQGREVQELKRGQIYIKDGKKFVAK